VFGGYMKKVGTFRGVDVYEDPNCPPGMLYFLNDNNIDFHAVSIDNRTKWQRIKDWVRRLFKHIGMVE
jgi:hypothetical protein